MSDDRVVVGRGEDVPDRGRKVVDIDGREIGVFRVDGELYAYGNYCVHAGGPVCQGMLVNRIAEVLDENRESRGEAYSDDLHIVCPWHGYEYDVRTGRHPAAPEVRLHSYRVYEEGGDIVVEL